MSDVEKPPPDDADRDVDLEDDLDPEAPTDSALTHPPRDDADRPVPSADDDAFDDLQQENAGSSLDQPSDQTS
ncbi:MAG: hypothetical protein JF565_08965 [Propionibacteriales bacterium]|nr:hypothetical protein [Propionibacteriales bacterium]